MADTITLEVATPQRRLVREEVDELQAPALDGYLGVWPRHAPLFTRLGRGVLSFRQGSEHRYLAIHGGVMEVLPDHVRVLPDGAEFAEEIDIERARIALQRAMDLLQSHEMEIDVERAEDAINRAQARLRAYEKNRPLG